MDPKYRIETVRFCSLPKTLKIKLKDELIETNKHWLQSISDFFNDLLTECDNDFIPLKEDDFLYFKRLIDFIENGYLVTDDLIDIFQVLILSHKYLIRTVDVDGIIKNLDVPSQYFKDFVDCLHTLYRTPKIDLIARQIKHDTDVYETIKVRYGETLLDEIESSKYYRYYGDGLLKKLIVALEISAKKHKSATKKTYFVRYNKQDYYRNISLHDSYYAYSMAEALLMFRDNLLYLSKRISSVKYIKGPYRHGEHFQPKVNKISSQIAPYDVLKKYVNNRDNYIASNETFISLLVDDKLEIIEKRIQGLLENEYFRMLEIVD